MAVFVIPRAQTLRFVQDKSYTPVIPPPPVPVEPQVVLIETFQNWVGTGEFETLPVGWSFSNPFGTRNAHNNIINTGVGCKMLTNLDYNPSGVMIIAHSNLITLLPNSNYRVTYNVIFTKVLPVSPLTKFSIKISTETSFAQYFASDNGTYTYDFSTTTGVYPAGSISFVLSCNEQNDFAAEIRGISIRQIL